MPTSRIERWFWDVRRERDHSSEAALLAELRAMGPEAVNVLLGMLKEGENGQFHGAAIQILGEMEESRAVDGLIEALHNDRPIVRYWAAEALGKIGDSRAVPFLEKILAEDTGEAWVEEKTRPGRSFSIPVAVMAVEAIEQTGEEPSETVLCDALAKGWRWPGAGEGDLLQQSLNRRVGAAFARMDHHSALQALRPLAKSSNVEVRVNVAEVLGHIPGPESRELLSGMLGDETPTVRQAAYCSLRKHN